MQKTLARLIHFCHEKSLLVRSEGRSISQMRGQANVIVGEEICFCQMLILCLSFQGLLLAAFKNQIQRAAVNGGLGESHRCETEPPPHPATPTRLLIRLQKTINQGIAIPHACLFTDVWLRHSFG